MIPRALPETILGSIGIVGTLTLNEISAVAVAAVTILALAPLAIRRWNRLLRGQRFDNDPET